MNEKLEKKGATVVGVLLLRAERYHKSRVIIVREQLLAYCIVPNNASGVPLARQFQYAVIAMVAVVVLSNWAVQYPINDWLTWGAFTYPLVFLVTDLTNRALGPAAARRVAWAGFAIAVGLSLLLAPWRIAVASGTAFIVAQLLDIAVFNRLRQSSWWQAPLLGSVLASLIDTFLFFFIAFYGTDLNWLTLGAGDLAVKCAMAVLLLAPYRALLPRVGVWRPTGPA